MLTGMKLTGSSQDISAYHSHQENYYFCQGSDERLAQDKKYNTLLTGEPLEYVKIHGELSKYLGYDPNTPISETEFSELLDGKDRNETKVVRKHKTNGIDLTFSAPKSLSVASLVTHCNPDLTEAHDQAVQDTMRELEKQAHGRPDNKHKEYTGKMCWVSVRDGFSREHDPHLHTHCIIMNMTRLANGKFTSLDGTKIIRADVYRMLDSMYKLNLAKRLKDLGYDITYFKNGEWKLDIVPAALEDAFSNRRKQILASKKLGNIDMDAWHKTREDKDPGVDKESIQNRWLKTVGKYGFISQDKNRAAALELRNDWSNAAKYSVEAEQERRGLRGKGTTEEQRWQLAIRRATENVAVVSKRKVITEYLNELMRSDSFDILTIAEAEYRLDEQVKQNNIVEISKDEYTSWEMMNADREYRSKVIEKVEQIFNEHDANAFVAKRKNTNGRKLSGVQEIAVSDIISSDRFLTVVQGDAGSGKTTALKAVGEAFKNKGINVIGLAMQGVAALNLRRETDIKSYTLASFLGVAKKNTTPKAIIFDEASMLDVRNATKLFMLAKNYNYRIILVGDRNQLESVGAGRVFDRLVSDCEKEKTLVSLYDNYRQRTPELIKSVDLIKQGKMCESIELLEKHGKVIEISDRHERRNKIAEQYDRYTLILAGTVSARDEMNIKIRERDFNKRKDADQSTNKTFNLLRTDREGIDQEYLIPLANKDIVTFGKNEYKDYDIRNGERGVITGINNNVLSVLLEDDRKLDIDTEKYKWIDYGYALTTYKAQGQSYDKVIVDSDTATPGLNDMRSEYVNITRARDDIKIYTDDIDDLKELASIKTFSKDTFSDNKEETLEHIVKQDKLISDMSPFIKNIEGIADKQKINDVNEILSESNNIPVRERHLIAGFLCTREAQEVWGSGSGLSAYNIVSLGEALFNPSVKKHRLSMHGPEKEKILNVLYDKFTGKYIAKDLTQKKDISQTMAKQEKQKPTIPSPGGGFGL
ncbi:MAG: hypothetical protein A3J83_05065 [Elusimicrobia bacterium RIFOXYA2_FULL_40_6]|nr:MAG: hypothetical protein A3J83_05065 [Elusimicrobia bacterium RIFOXYA2_FULL_40_6]